MLRTRLLTATAAVALFAAGSVFAQTAPASPAAPSTTPPVAAGEPAETPVAAPSQDAATAAAAIENSVVDVLRANGQFTTLLTALDAAQLTETLRTQPAISIFAPTDAAFAALPEADRARLMDPANVNELRQVLLYHVIVADVTSAQIEGTKGGVQTAATTEVQLDGTGDAIKVDNATVTTADVDAGNGSIFIIDRVLSPSDSLVATGDAEEATAPADEPAAAEAMDADSATDEGTVAPVPTAPAAAAPVAAAPTAPMASPAPTGMTAPNGHPAGTTTTTASPPVANPTDGQVDDAAADEDMDEAPAPTPQA